jgi:hypothetical protein
MPAERTRYRRCLPGSGAQLKSCSAPALRQQRLAYLHRNPVIASFVDTPEDFLYSSARNYAGRPGLLDVLLIN